MSSVIKLLEACCREQC